MAGDLVGNADEEEARRGRHSFAADHDQVGVVLFGDGGERLGWVLAVRVRDGRPSIVLGDASRPGEIVWALCCWARIR